MLRVRGVTSTEATVTAHAYTVAALCDAKQKCVLLTAAQFKQAPPFLYFFLVSARGESGVGLIFQSVEETHAGRVSPS